MTVQSAETEEHEEDEWEDDWDEDEKEEHEEEEDDEPSEAFIAMHLGACGLLPPERRKKERKAEVHDVNLVLVNRAMKLARKGLIPPLKKKEKKDGDMNLILVTGPEDGSTGNKILIDTGCVRTVCGTGWLKEVLDSLDPDIRKEIKVERSRQTFKFGCGEVLKSLGRVEIPCSINRKNVWLETEIVPSDTLPCLLSKAAMKRARVKIDTEKDTMDIFGQTTNLINSGNGHYFMEISGYIPDEKNQESIILVTDLEEAKDQKELMKKLEKMHHTLGHPSRRVFENMVKHSNMNKHLTLRSRERKTLKKCFKNADL